MGTPYYAHLQNLIFLCFNQKLTPTPLLHKAVLNKKAVGVELCQ